MLLAAWHQCCLQQMLPAACHAPQIGFFETAKVATGVSRLYNLLMRLHHSLDVSTFPGLKLMCFVYMLCFFG
jgi:hypothetical protein